ncbi:acid protease [Dentipellis sp. KUC8613]|nr:acid protease [Dentipellis sp. KUC8613]
MLPFSLLFVLAVLDVAWAGLVARIPERRRQPLRLHEHIRRQISNGTVANTTSSGIVPITLADDKQTYYSVLNVGNISFRSAIDSGSADFWLLSSGCSTSACKSPPKYPLNYASPTFVSVNNNASTFNLSFADGSNAVGFVARETVQLANLTVPNQAFGLVNSSTVSFVDEISGVLGLGFPRLSTIYSVAANATPFLGSLASGHLDYPLFGVSLTRNSTSGTLAFGAIDSTVVQNASLIEWNEVVPFQPFLGSPQNTSSYLQWAIPLANIQIGSTTVKPQPTYPQANGNSSIALLDIGTAGLFGPYQDVERIFSALSGSRIVNTNGQWAIPCDTNDTLTFTFGAQNFTMLPSDYLLGPIQEDPNLCYSWPQATPPSSDGIDWQIGSSFLRTVYTIFSYGITSKEPPMIGLYPLTPSTPAPTALPQASLSALFSSLSLTVSVGLPNSLVPTPTFTTPPYAFNTSVPTSLISGDLATSTYTPLLSNIDHAGGAPTGRFNFSALPQVAPAPTVQTLVLTASNGAVFTTTSTLPSQSLALGKPPGWTSSAALKLAMPQLSACVAVAMTCMLVVAGAIY